MRETRAVELHELADDPVLAQPLGDREHQVRRRDPFRQPAGQFHAEHLRDQHGRGLTQHRGFRLDAADTPSHDPEPVHHRRVRVGADKRVGIRQRALRRLGGYDDAREVFEIHLVDDARVRRNHAEIAKRVLSPAQERVALLVARELEVGVQPERISVAEGVHLHRVIDDQLDGLQRVHLVRIAAEPDDAIAHRREVDHAGHAGEILQQDARGHERHFALRGALHVPRRERLDVGLLHEPAVFLAEQVLQQDLQRVRQAGDVGESGFLKGGETVNLKRTSAHGKGGPRVEAVHGGHEGWSFGGKCHRTTPVWSGPPWPRPWSASARAGCPRLWHDFAVKASSPALLTALEGLTPEQQAWAVRSEALWRHAHAIAAAHPGHDASDLYHALRCLQLSPSDRLRLGLRRERLHADAC